MINLSLISIKKPLSDFGLESGFSFLIIRASNFIGEDVWTKY